LECYIKIKVGYLNCHYTDPVLIILTVQFYAIENCNDNNNIQLYLTRAIIQLKMKTLKLTAEAQTLYHS